MSCFHPPLKFFLNLPTFFRPTIQHHFMWRTIHFHLLYSYISCSLSPMLNFLFLPPFASLPNKPSLLFIPNPSSLKPFPKRFVTFQTFHKVSNNASFPRIPTLPIPRQKSFSLCFMFPPKLKLSLPTIIHYCTVLIIYLLILLMFLLPFPSYQSQ